MWGYSPGDFIDLAPLPALHRVESEGTIRRVIRGPDDYPKFSELLGQQLSPDANQVATAVARKFRWRIQPRGAPARRPYQADRHLQVVELAPPRG